jgi:hypothetical protein
MQEYCEFSRGTTAVPIRVIYGSVESCGMVTRVIVKDMMFGTKYITDFPKDMYTVLRDRPFICGEEASTYINLYFGHDISCGVCVKVWIAY